MMNLLPFVASGLGLGGVYALSGVALVVLYRASGTVNFALGALGAFGAHCAWSLLHAKSSPLLAWIVSASVAAALSFLYGRLVAPALQHRDQTVRAIGTLGFALVLLGTMGLVWGETIPRRLTLPTDVLFITVFAVRVTYTRVLALLLAITMVGGVWLLLHRTRIGLAMRALANDRKLSDVIGIDVVAVDSVAWLISGALAGISGLLLADLVRLQPTFLTFLIIPAIAAAILGRLTSLTWTLIGGVLIGLVEALLTAVPVIASYRSAAPYLIALLFVAIWGGRLVARSDT